MEYAIIIYNRLETYKLKKKIAFIPRVGFF